MYNLFCDLCKVVHPDISVYYFSLSFSAEIMIVYFYGNSGGGKGRVFREKKARMLQEGKQHETENNSQK